MTDYPTEQRKIDAETLRYVADTALLGSAPEVRAIADRLDPAHPPMTLREALALDYYTFDQADAALAVIADPAHRAEVLALLGFDDVEVDAVQQNQALGAALVEARADIARLSALLGEPDLSPANPSIAAGIVDNAAVNAELRRLASDPAPQTYDADNPPPVGSLVVWRDRAGLPFAVHPRSGWLSLLHAYGNPLAVFPPTGGVS